MKYLLLLALLCVINMVNADDVYVNGYYRADGTPVAPYHRSSPDGNPYNNYSTKGNVNPYTGEPGYKNPHSFGDGYSGGYHAPKYSSPSNSLELDHYNSSGLDHYNHPSGLGHYNPLDLNK